MIYFLYSFSYNIFKYKNNAVTTIYNDISNVARDVIGEIFNPSIPIINKVIGVTVKKIPDK